jgi:hypothetical protein
MKILALAVLLAVMQASPPVPGQTADSSDDASRSVQRQTQTDAKKELPAKSSPSVNSEQPPSHDARGNGQGTENAEPSMSISKLPSVTIASPKRDWADWGVWVFTLLLAATSVLQIWLLSRTLRYVRRQTHEMRHQRHEMWRQRKAMQGQVAEMESQTEVLKASVASAEKSADAAKISADIAAGVSVPTLVVDEFDLGNPPGASLEAMLQFPTIKLVVKNYGQTPAFLRSWCVVFTCEELPEVPDYYGHPASGIVLDKVVIQPNDPFTFPSLPGWRRHEFSLDDVDAIMERRKILNVYGCVCYGDIFGNPIRRLKFCETAMNLFPGNDPRIDWFSQLAPTVYRGTDLMPIKAASWQRLEDQNR